MKRRKEGNSGPMFLRKGRRSTVWKRKVFLSDLRHLFNERLSACLSLSLGRRSLRSLECYWSRNVISAAIQQLFSLFQLGGWTQDLVLNTGVCYKRRSISHETTLIRRLIGSQSSGRQTQAQGLSVNWIRRRLQKKRKLFLINRWQKIPRRDQER